LPVAVVRRQCHSVIGVEVMLGKAFKRLCVLCVPGGRRRVRKALMKLRGGTTRLPSS